jgi:hypothetical protein
MYSYLEALYLEYTSDSIEDGATVMKFVIIFFWIYLRESPKVC